ncbi:hypothetical protein ACF0H5_001599 [Mactra antiquata]
MRLVLLTLVISMFAACISAACQNNHDCNTICSDGYHSQCVNSACHCPHHQCAVKSDCPQGNGSGCPPLCDVHCINQVCQCSCPTDG